MSSTFHSLSASQSMQNQSQPDDQKTAQTAQMAGEKGGALPDSPKCYKNQNESIVLRQAQDRHSAQINAADADENEIVEMPRPLNLTGPQIAAIELIILGKVDRVVAEQVGVHLKTVTRWRLYHAAFRAELARRRNEVWGATADRYRGLLESALDNFTDNLTGPDKLAAFRAAKNLLSMAKKFAPPDEPIDPRLVVEHHARLMKRAYQSIDPMIEEVDDEDMQLAKQDLSRRLNEEAA